MPPRRRRFGSSATTSPFPCRGPIDRARSCSPSTDSTPPTTTANIAGRILKRIHELYEKGLNPGSDGSVGLLSIAADPLLQLKIYKPRKKVNVMLIGNHSAGESQASSTGTSRRACRPRNGHRDPRVHVRHLWTQTRYPQGDATFAFDHISGLSKFKEHLRASSRDIHLQGQELLVRRPRRLPGTGGRRDGVPFRRHRIHRLPRGPRRLDPLLLRPDRPSSVQAHHENNPEAQRAPRREASVLHEARPTRWRRSTTDRGF